MTKQRERFELDAKSCKFEVQPAAAGGLPTLSGYAIVWNVDSSDRGGYVARFAKGSATPAADGVQALYAHDSQKVLGNTENGSLRLTSDDYGVKVEIDPPATTYAADVVALVRGKYVQGMSFGMNPVSYTDSVEDGQNVRTFSAFEYDEVTITGIPAFSETSIAAQFNATPAAAAVAAPAGAQDDAPDLSRAEFDAVRFRFLALDD